MERGRPQRQHDRPVHRDLERRRRCARPAAACSPASARGRWARRSRGPRRGRSRDTPRPAWTSRRRPGAGRPAPGRRRSPSSSSSSCIRVSGVRRSWLTAASISVRWLMWRRMRWRIRLKACAAWRISKAPRRPEVADVAALAEAVGGPGELADRPDLQAQEEDRDRREHDRAADHPGEQEPGRGAGHPLARRDARSAGRARAGRRRRRGPDRRSRGRPRTGRAAARRRLPGSCCRCGRHWSSMPAAATASSRRPPGVSVMSRSVLRGARSMKASRARRVGRLLDRLGEQRHLAGDAERQPAGHRVPVAVVEDVGEQDLQDQQRHDDDQQRAPEQAARHDQPARASGAAPASIAAQLPSRST